MRLDQQDRGDINKGEERRHQHGGFLCFVTAAPESWCLTPGRLLCLLFSGFDGLDGRPQHHFRRRICPRIEEVRERPACE